MQPRPEKKVFSRIIARATIIVKPLFGLTALGVGVRAHSCRCRAAQRPRQRQLLASASQPLPVSQSRAPAPASLGAAGHWPTLAPDGGNRGGGSGGLSKPSLALEKSAQNPLLGLSADQSQAAPGSSAFSSVYLRATLRTLF